MPLGVGRRLVEFEVDWMSANIGLWCTGELVKKVIT
jgi:hypothetical protein